MFDKYFVIIFFYYFYSFSPLVLSMEYSIVSKGEEKLFTSQCTFCLFFFMQIKQGLPPAMMNVIPGYFHKKIGEKSNQKKSLAVCFPAYL